MATDIRTHGRSAKEMSGGPLLAGLMIGGLVGAASMLLLAPQAGTKTRKEIRAGALDIRDRTTDTMNDAVSQVRSRARWLAGSVSDKVNDLQNQGKDIAVDQLDRVSKAALAGKRAVQSSKNE
ncbi:MAG TPA: YtxH domain-containing protein [Anaerolineales bacterium]